MRRPEPCCQRQFRPLHRSAGGERGLATAIEAFEKPRAALQSHSAPHAARRTNKPVRPASSVKKRRATCLVGKFHLKLCLLIGPCSSDAAEQWEPYDASVTYGSVSSPACSPARPPTRRRLTPASRCWQR